MSFSRQRGKPTRQKRLITLSNLLTNSTQLVDRHYSHFSVRAATTTLRVPSAPRQYVCGPCTNTRVWARARMHTKTHALAVLVRGTMQAHTSDTRRKYTREHTQTGHSDHVCYWSFNEGTEWLPVKLCTSNRAFSFELSKGRAAVVNIHRTLFSARVPADALPSDRSYRSLPYLLAIADRQEKEGRVLSHRSVTLFIRARRQIHSRVKVGDLLLSASRESVEKR